MLLTGPTTCRCCGLVDGWIGCWRPVLKWVTATPPTTAAGQWYDCCCQCYMAVSWPVLHGLLLSCPAADQCYMAYAELPSSSPVLYGLPLTCPAAGLCHMAYCYPAQQLICIAWLTASLLSSWTVLHGWQLAFSAAELWYMDESTPTQQLNYKTWITPTLPSSWPVHGW